MRTRCGDKVWETRYKREAPTLHPLLIGTLVYRAPSGLWRMNRERFRRGRRSPRSGSSFAPDAPVPPASCPLPPLSPAPIPGVLGVLAVQIDRGVDEKENGTTTAGRRRHSTIVTGVPSGTSMKSSSTSLLRIRMQPALDCLPRVAGSQVPWMP